MPGPRGERLDHPGLVSAPAASTEPGAHMVTWNRKGQKDRPIPILRDTVSLRADLLDPKLDEFLRLWLSSLRADLDHLS
jgi:hypothetical protein